MPHQRFLSQTSYPFLTLARVHNVDYGHVLHYATMAERALRDHTDPGVATNIWEQNALVSFRGNRDLTIRILSFVAYLVARTQHAPRGSSNPSLASVPDEKRNPSLPSEARH